MRTLLLIVIFLTSHILSAQDTITSCKANFGYKVNTEVKTFAPSSVFDFIDLSEGGAINWFWDFGDGQTSYEQNPTHIYNLPINPPVSSVPPNPYRTVTLTISTVDSCNNTYSKTIDIFDRDIDNEPLCFAEFKHFTLSYDSIGATQTFQFSNRSEGKSLSYLWQFDNGETSTEAEPTVTYDFSKPMHKVILTITGADGCTDSYYEGVFVSFPDDGWVDNEDSSQLNCIVPFGYTINKDYKTFAPALVLDFYAKSDEEIVNWYWDFGDGNTSNEPNPTHGFNYPVYKDSFFVDQNIIRTVCLQTTTTSGCISNWCQEIDINTGTEPYEKECNYSFKYTSSYPKYASACIGKASAQVVLKDSAISTEYYYWSTDTEGQDVEHLCPTRTYTVTALTTDGCKFSGSFIFNSDGTITEIPINWWITIKDNDSILNYNKKNLYYTVEWILCDGTVITGDSIPLANINCGSNMANLIMRDPAGNVVYNEMIELKSGPLSKKDINVSPKIYMFPVPVNNVLNVRYNNYSAKPISFEISDLSGRILIKHEFGNFKPLQIFNVDVSSLQKGIYLGKIISGNKIIAVEKFSK